MKLIAALTAVLSCAGSACAVVRHGAQHSDITRQGDTSPRSVLLRQAQVWRPTHISRMDLQRGPQGPG